MVAFAALKLGTNTSCLSQATLEYLHQDLPKPLKATYPFLWGPVLNTRRLLASSQGRLRQGEPRVWHRTITIVIVLIWMCLTTAVAQGVCDRTPQVRDILVWKAGVSECGEVTSEHLSAVKSLSFYEIGTLRTGDFDGLTSLQDLDLSHCQLTTLPEGLFHGLKSLQDLDLGYNQLTALPEGFFRDLTSLQLLFLASNQLTTLPEGLFRGLKSLIILDLQSNQLTTVPEGLFRDLTSLQNLYLTNNQLASLPEGVFSDLNSLTELRLGSNRLTSLPAGVFRGLTSLQYLYLTNNQLASLPEGVFSDLNALVWLLLRINHLTSLPQGVFEGLASLDWMSLSRNLLTSLSAGVFSGLDSLRQLDLVENRLVSLQKDVFSPLNSIRSLRLQKNQLTALPNGVFDDVLDTLAGPLRKVYYRRAPGYFIEHGELVLDGALKTLLSVASPDLDAPPGSTVIIAVTLSRDLPLALHVPYSVRGTSDEYTDRLLFLPGETEKEINLTVSDSTDAAERIPEVTVGELSEIKFRQSDGTGSFAPFLKAESFLLDPDEPDANPDPRDSTMLSAAELAGQRLTLKATPTVGTDGLTWEGSALVFHKSNRFEQIPQSTADAGATDPRSGRYDYLHTGQRRGTLTLNYDDGESCTLEISFASASSGTFMYACSSGNSGSGNFLLRVPDIFVPVVLSSAGVNNAFFTSELTLINRGTRQVWLDYTYTAHDGKGSGTASETLPVGQQIIVPNAVGHLRDLGIPIPDSGKRIGTLRIAVSGSSGVKILVRTTTSVPEGRAGLAYPGVGEHNGFEGTVYLCGLRQNSQDRSNVAFQNMGTEEEGTITLRTTVYSGEASDTSPRELDDVTLEPGGFHQYNQVLSVLGSNANGYVKVERVEGTAPFYAYGVINDQVNSDGSFVFPVTAGSLEEAAGQTLPVVVETGGYTSELTVTNFSETSRTVHFDFVADGVGTDEETARFSLTLEAGEQRIIADVVDDLRRQGVAGIGPGRRSYAGAVFAAVQGGDMSGIVIGARTGSLDGRGGQYGVFYTAVPDGAGFTDSAWVDGLQQNEENRSNLALVNTGEVDGSESVFRLEIYDGETGMLVKTVATGPIPARRWYQINGILGNYAPGTRQGYIRILQILGSNPFLAYGVVNDGGAPGERSGDGAYLPARE